MDVPDQANQPDASPNTTNPVPAMKPVRVTLQSLMTRLIVLFLLSRRSMELNQTVCQTIRRLSKMAALSLRYRNFQQQPQQVA